MTASENAEFSAICTELCELFHAGTLEKARYMELARKAAALVGDDWEEMEPVYMYGEKKWLRELDFIE